MRRRSRRRRVLKWAGLVGSVTVIVAWAMTVRRVVVYNSGEYALLVGQGSITCDGYHAHLPPGWSVQPTVGRLRWWPNAGPGILGIWKAALPFWLVVVALSILTTILWWRDHCPPKGHCQTCGYDLTGNVSGQCPECGEGMSRRDI